MASSLRLFLDTNVFIEAFLLEARKKFAPSRIIVSLAYSKDYKLILGEVVEIEVKRNLNRLKDLEGIKGLVELFENLLETIAPIKVPIPSKEELKEYKFLLPYIKHESDLPVVVSAIKGRADVIISSNKEHIGIELEKKIKIPIFTPKEFWEYILKSIFVKIRGK
jgi:predicted nucleic acid-binding protein